MAQPKTILLQGKVYTVDDALYAEMSKYNSPGNAIFDDEPEIMLGERVLRQPDKPDIGDTEAAQGAKPIKQPVFTATDADVGLAPKPPKPDAKK